VKRSRIVVRELTKTFRDGGREVAAVQGASFEIHDGEFVAIVGPSGCGKSTILNIIAFNSLPRIALVPLITMIFGFGLLAKIVLAWTIVFFIVFFNTFQGARSVDADLIHSARFLGGNDRQIMRTVIVPSALAWTFASLTPSISFALIGVVVGEFLGGESGGGLGYLIILSLGTLNAADMMVALIALGVIGIAMALGIKQIEKRLLRWRPEYRSRT
jgi:NitT/TauT family transport system permease protein